MARLLVGLALGSGCAALIYEAIWLRWFRLLFGNTAYAASATLSAFFAGMALGALLFGRFAPRVRRPLAVYAAIEAGTALTALLVPLAVSAYEPIYAFLYERLADQPTLFVAIKFTLALLAVIPTATLLGGTLPMLATALSTHRSTRDGSIGRRVSGLYAINTLGAALGSAAGSLWLPEALGVRASYGVAIGLSLLVAAAALALSRVFPEATPEPVPESGAQARRGWVAVSFVSGFGVLAFEVLLIQTVALALDSSVYSFGAVLIVVLTTLGLSSLVVAALPDRWRGERLLIGSLAVTAGLLALLPIGIVGFTGELASHSRATFGNGLRLALLFGGLPLLVGGLVLPLTFRLAQGGDVGPRIGGLLAANTLGGIAGSTAASFLLLDGLGLWRSIGAIAALYALAAVVLCRTPKARATVAALALIGGLAVAVGPANPGALPIARIAAHQRLVAVDEGAHGVVAVVDSLEQGLERDRLLQIDGHYTLSGALARGHQARLGHLPLVLHGAPRHALYVGTATGETASASVVHPLEQMTLVELVPEVQALAAEHFAEMNRGVYHDPRTRVVVEDGRNHIRATTERYDAIVMDLFVPERPGVGGMYTRDSFAAALERLNEGGVLCIWLPIYQLDDDLFQILAATFVEVFPEAMLWRGDFFTHLPTAALIGVRGSSPSAEAISAAGIRLGDRGVDDRWLTDPRGLWMLYLGALTDVLDTGEPRRINTDDRPIFEYVAARSTRRKRVDFKLRTWPALADRVLSGATARSPAGLDSAGPSGQPQRPSGSAKASSAMARAQQLTVRTKQPQWAEAAALLRANVAQELLEVPDRNIAETWPTASGARQPERAAERD